MNNVVAAFDFDGTLTYRDTLLPFLFSIAGYATGTCKLIAQAPQLAIQLLKQASRQEIKEGFLTRFLQHTPIQEARKYGEKFAQDTLQQRLNPQAMQRLQWHLDQRHRCILVSANLDLYLEPWGKLAGFHDIVTSQCEVGNDNTLTGKLQGLNCWGPEKARRLAELLGPRHGYTLYAYGNSRGDQELLALADYPFYRQFFEPLDIHDN